MRLAVFYIWGSLLAFSLCDICPETSEDAASWVKLKPLGHCGDEDNLCPYRLTLPPLSIQLPRPFRELEKMAKELQNLKQVVNQLRRDCQECKDRHSIERGERTDHTGEEERRPQSPRHSIGIGPTGEQDVQTFTSILLQGDRSESEATVKGGMKGRNHSILEGQKWNIDPTVDLNEGTTDQRSEMSREVKIFNPSLDEVPDDVSKIKLVPTPVGTEWELKSKQSEIIEPSLPRKKDDVHSAISGKQLLDILRDGRVKNISGILTVRRVQNVPDPNGLSSTSRNANTQTMDLSTSAGNRKVVKPSGAGGTLRPKGSYTNSRTVKINNEDRLKNPALVRKTNPHDGDMTVKIEPEEAGFSPARSGVMRVKETSPRIANTKPGTISGSTPSTDNKQNKQDISMVSGPKTEDGHGLKDPSQATIIRENNLRNINTTDIAKLPTTLKQEKQSDVSHTDANKSVSNIMNKAEQQKMVKEEKKQMGLSESLVVISSETVPSADREDMPFSGRQVEKEKYLNPITETNNGQIGSKVLDKADSNFNSRTVNPMSPDLRDKTQPETVTEGANEETGFNSLSSETEKDILSHSKATLSEKDLVQPTIVPTVKGRLIDSAVRRTSRVKSPVVSHGTRRTSITPLKMEAKQPQNSNKNISKIEVSREIRYVMPETTVILPKGPKMGQFNMTNKMPANRSVGVPSKLPIPFRNGNTARKNISGIVKPHYMRKKPNFQTEANTNRGIKTKVSTVTQFFSPTGATSTVEQEQTEEIKHIPQVIRSHLLDNHRLKDNTELQSHSESQNVGDVRDFDKVQEEKNSEDVLISNTEDSAEDPDTMRSGTSNSPTGEKERTADINSQHPSELDRISSGKKKRPTAPTLDKELSKEPGTSRFTTSAVSFTDMENEDSTKYIRKVTNTTKNVSRENFDQSIRATPNEKSTELHNRWLRNNSTESKPRPESQNVGNAQDLDKTQQGKNQVGDNSENVLISNIENSAEDPNTLQIGESIVPTGGKESRIPSLSTTGSSGKAEVDKKRLTAPNLKKEFSKEPGTTQFTTSTVSFTDTENEDSTKNIRTVTNTAKNISRDAPKGFENIRATPNKKSNALHNRWLKNNSTETKAQPESQKEGNAQDLEVQQGKNQDGDNSENVLISNIENSAEDANTLQNGESNLPTDGKESKTPSLATAQSSGQVEVDKISIGKKRPTAPTLKKELPKKTGTTQFTTSTVSFTETDLEGSTKGIHTVTNTHAEMAKNVNRDTPISFENIGATRELELIKLNKDRVEENPGEVLSNPNRADMAQGYSKERYTVPVVLETLTNVEEIKGSKLFSLSPEDTAEGFKSHTVSDEVTQREQAENKIHSTCLGDCNTTSIQHSQPSAAQTRTPFVSGREKGPAQDCADYMTKSRRNGVYRVTPRPKNTTFPVFCDMESSGGGWTLIQHRFDGSTSFNRTWDEYKNGFGKLIGEFWLGNDKIHFLTKAKNMSLRIEIEDFEGNREYAHYDHFYVANETQQYRLSIGGYSGTAGDAMQFSEKYNHDQKLFTTPDRDNDQYPSGNCGAYYSSGWWFDACMSANLNGKYYQSKYKGVRNGIFWGTWHNITMEYYPTNDRQSFKTVRMMIRPKNYSN